MIIMFLCFTAALVLLGVAYTAMLFAEGFIEQDRPGIAVVSFVLGCCIAGAAATCAVYPFMPGTV